MPQSIRTETTELPQARRPSPSQNAAEHIRRREVSRILKKMDLSPEEKEAIERFSHSLVAKLLPGPISEVMMRAEIWASQRGESR